jgi:hypothetical protein
MTDWLLIPLDLLLSVIWFAALVSATQRPRVEGQYIVIDGRRVPVKG